MRSQKQIEASRINGAKSRGPVTPEGKRNSSRNGWRQNILARFVVLPGESRERLNELYHSLIGELKPATAIESLLVQKMAVAQWRQMRLWGAEEISISVFETRYDRQFDRALVALNRLRTQQTKQNKTAGYPE